MNKDIYREINSGIEDMGNGFGPGLINLFLYGPFDKSFITSDNLELLKTKEFINQEIYSHLILPKIQSIVTKLTHSSIRVSKNKHTLLSKLEISPFESIREKINSEYSGQFNLDETTKNALSSKEILKENDYIRFAFLNDLMVSTRMKKLKNSQQKYKTIFKENQLTQPGLLDFLSIIANDPIEFWQNFEIYEELYSKPDTKIGNYTDMMLGDDFGLKIVDLNQTRSDENLEKLVETFSSTKIPGFKIVPSRFDDHRERLKSYRPGGLHYTIIDIGLTNFPIEVQVQSLKSYIYDKFGPNSHELYSFRGKKSSDQY
jgi:hypothetical protein